MLFFTGPCSEIIGTKSSIDIHEARGDDLKFSVSFPPGKKLLLRFWLGHSARAFEHYARLAKDAFRAFGFAEEQIIAISLTASHSPSLKLFITKDGIKHRIHVDVNLLEGTNSSVEPLNLKRELDQTGKDTTYVCLFFPIPLERYEYVSLRTVKICLYLSCIKHSTVPFCICIARVNKFFNG